MSIAALVIAGGRSARLGTPKAHVEIDGRELIDHVYDAVRSADPVIAVGPVSISRAGVVVVREDPPFGGPAAAVVAGLAALAPASEEALLLACDLPRADALVARLTAAPIPDGFDGLVAVDADDRWQWLAGRYRVGALRRAAAELPEPQNASLRALLGALTLRPVPVGDDAVDLDTWSAIEDYRRQQRGAAET